MVPVFKVGARDIALKLTSQTSKTFPAIVRDEIIVGLFWKDLK